MSKQAIFVGGCPASYHRLEGAEPPVRSALEALGYAVEVTGIFHPDGGEAMVGDYAALSESGLAGKDLLVLFTTGHGQGEDPAAVREWVRAGGALVGIHCAADSFTQDAEWVAFLGGRFRTHPAPLDVALEFTDPSHPITAGVEPFTVRDELYLFADHDPSRVHLLAQTRSYDGEGTDPIPVAWTREEGQGRIFYLSLGHFPEAMAHPGWQALFANGVRWATRTG